MELEFNMENKQNMWGKLFGRKKKKPNRIYTEVVRFENDEESWMALVGLRKEKPYKFFMGPSKKILIPDYVKEGEIVEQKLKNNLFYEFNFNDEGYSITFPFLSSSFDKEDSENSQLVSKMLQEGKKLKKILRSFKSAGFSGENSSAWKKNAEMVLKRYF